MFYLCRLFPLAVGFLTRWIRWITTWPGGYCERKERWLPKVLKKHYLKNAAALENQLSKSQNVQWVFMSAIQIRNCRSTTVAAVSFWCYGLMSAFTFTCMRSIGIGFSWHQWNLDRHMTWGGKGASRGRGREEQYAQCGFGWQADPHSP